MQQPAEILHLSSEITRNSILKPLKQIVKDSTHSYERLAYDMICDLEDMAAHHLISFSDLDVIIGKAADVLAYFRYDVESLARENSWYRAAVIHQICCGMLQVIYLVRPDLSQSHTLSETAYHLYRHQKVEKTGIQHDHEAHKPITCKYWAQA